MYLSVVVLFAIAVHTGSTLKCLICDDVIQPRHCKMATTCASGEVCFVEEFNAANGETRYNVGCRSRSNCYQKRQSLLDVLTRRSYYSCSNCCYSDICNSAGCGTPGYPATSMTGNICFSCNEENDPSRCENIAFCSADESCFLDKIVEFGDSVYTSGCRRNYHCPSNTVHASSNLFGKRQISHDYCVSSSCSRCCQSNLCNDEFPLIRLASGYSNSRYLHEGRLEVYHNGVWGTICDDGARNTIAQVACREMGYTQATAYVKQNAYFGSGSGKIWMDEVSCSGNEDSLTKCSFDPWGSNDCSHSEDLSVVCRDTQYPFRLAKTNSGYPEYEGRLEINVNGTWGTVCDDDFDNDAASVACYMFGFSRYGALAKSNAYFGQGTGSILLDDVDCSGSETNIMACSHSAVGHHNCGHGEDVGIVCQH